MLRFRSLKLRVFNDIRIISVDNLSFGGTGKTPLVIEIGRILEDAGKKFSIVTRGYGSSNVRKGILAGRDQKWTEVGDEVKMFLSELQGIDIFVGRDRINSIIESRKRGNTIVILDDGFQSANIKKDIKIMLINTGHKYFYLRNFKFMTRDEDIILYYKSNGGMNDLSGDGDIPVSSNYFFEFDGFFTFDGLPADPENLPVYGFSALGDNDRFRSDLESMNLKGFHGFNDHHIYKRKDLVSLKKKMTAASADFLICTQKDFVKLLDILEDGFPLIYVKNRIKCDIDLKSYILTKIK